MTEAGDGTIAALNRATDIFANSRRSRATFGSRFALRRSG